MNPFSVPSRSISILVCFDAVLIYFFRSLSRSGVETTLEDKTKELMEESRMVLVEFSIDRVSLGVHSMGEAML